MSKVLVVYYSRTGNTRRLAEAIAGAGGFDIEPVIDSRRRLGLLGYLRSGYEASLARLTPIAPPQHDVGGYDLVVVGTPIWNFALSSPIRTFLSQQREKLERVAFFLTCGGRGDERVFAQMAAAAGQDPIATLTLRERDIAHGALEPRAHELATVLRDYVARTSPLHPEPPPAMPPA